MATQTASQLGRQSVQRALTALELVLLAVGVLQFAFAPAAINRPILAVSTLGALASMVMLLRLISVSPKRAALQYLLDLVLMSAAVTLLALASGGSRSTLLPLYLLPLAAAALAYGRWWVVLLVASSLASLVFLIGALTPGIDIEGIEFGVALVSALVPGTVVALMLASFVERMDDAARKIRDLAATDALTGLLNLRTFEGVLQQEHRKAERSGRPYSIVMIDVDNLSQVNESLGHEAGSLVLNAVASAITRSVRVSDIVARFGGDEFIVLCTESNPEIATAIAQRIRNNVYAGTVSVANRLIRANANVGVANFPTDHLYPKELVVLAGQRMQQERDSRREDSERTG